MLKRPRQSRCPIGLCLALAFATPALAAPYEVEIDIENEEDLYDLAETEQISEATLETLLDLLQEGVDVNTANRDELYELPNLTYSHVDAILNFRKRVGRIDDPADLVRAQVLPAELFDQIAPFLLVTSPKKVKRAYQGYARLGSLYSAGDTLAPPFYLKASGFGFEGWKAGLFAATTRRDLNNVRYDPFRNALTADEPTYRLHPAKYFASFRNERYAFVAGTFTAGFGERLTLNNTNRVEPDGLYGDADYRIDRELSGRCVLSPGELPASPCTPEELNGYLTNDPKWTRRFRGFGGALRGLPMGAFTSDVHLFGSYERKNISQYGLYDKALCDNPFDDSPQCQAPPVYLRTGEPLLPSPVFRRRTLPEVFDEMLFGSHARLHFGAGQSAGVTGYFARDFFVPRGIALGFQEWVGRPNGNFGAVGVDGAYNYRTFNFFAEVTRSFNAPQIPGTAGPTGGWGVIQRTTYDVTESQALELSLRYYDRDFVNPYARALSARDELLGYATRNEAGARLRYNGRRMAKWAVRGDLDVWAWPGAVARGTAGRANLKVFARGDYKAVKWLEPSVWAEYFNRDLGVGGRGLCFEDPSAEDEDGVTIPCSGERFRLGGKVKYLPLPKLRLALQYQHYLLDDRNYPAGFQNNGNLAAEVSYKPLDNLRMKVRSRYANEDYATGLRGEDQLYSYIFLGYLPMPNLVTGVRYENVAYLDQRPSTLRRTPSPESRFRIEIEGRF